MESGGGYQRLALGGGDVARLEICDGHGELGGQKEKDARRGEEKAAR